MDSVWKTLVRNFEAKSTILPLIPILFTNVKEQQDNAICVKWDQGLQRRRRKIAEIEDIWSS